MTTKAGAMSEAEIRARHEESQGPWPEGGHVCLGCWQRWPCDAFNAYALLDAERARRHTHDEPVSVEWNGIEDCHRAVQTCSDGLALARLRMPEGWTWTLAPRETGGYIAAAWLMDPMNVVTGDEGVVGTGPTIAEAADAARAALEGRG